MPLIILKKVWKYCTYSKKYIIFIFILLLLSELFQNYLHTQMDDVLWVIFQIFIFILLYGYGMTITRDRINHGERLPKIVIKDIIFFGFKSSIVFIAYTIVQDAVLGYFSYLLKFPVFNLENMLLNFWQTLDLLLTSEPIHTILFLTVGSILFYVTIFFVEIAIARLADTGSIKQAFNFKAIKKNISTFGWKNYTIDYTIIIVSIVILDLIKAYPIPIFIVDHLVDVFLGFLIFATQFLGIGAVYCHIKDIETERKRIYIQSD